MRECADPVRRTFRVAFLPQQKPTGKERKKALIGIEPKLSDKRSKFCLRFSQTEGTDQSCVTHTVTDTLDRTYSLPKFVHQNTV